MNTLNVQIGATTFTKDKCLREDQSEMDTNTDAIFICLKKFAMSAINRSQPRMTRSKIPKITKSIGCLRIMLMPIQKITDRSR